MNKQLKRAFFLYRTYQLNTTGRAEYNRIAESMRLTRLELNARMNQRLNDWQRLRGAA